MDIASEDFELPREAILLVGGLLGRALPSVSSLVSVNLPAQGTNTDLPEQASQCPLCVLQKTTATEQVPCPFLSPLCGAWVGGEYKVLFPTGGTLKRVLIRPRSNKSIC